MIGYVVFCVNEIWKAIIFIVQAVLESDLEISGEGRGGGKCGHAVFKKFVSALLASVWSRNKGGTWAPGPLPWIRRCPRNTDVSFFYPEVGSFPISISVVAFSVTDAPSAV